MPNWCPNFSVHSSSRRLDVRLVGGVIDHRSSRVVSAALLFNGKWRSGHLKLHEIRNYPKFTVRQDFPRGKLVGTCLHLAPANRQATKPEPRREQRHCRDGNRWTCGHRCLRVPRGLHQWYHRKRISEGRAGLLRLGLHQQHRAGHANRRQRSIERLGRITGPGQRFRSRRGRASNWDSSYTSTTQLTKPSSTRAAQSRRAERTRNKPRSPRKTIHCSET